MTVRKGRIKPLTSPCVSKVHTYSNNGFFVMRVFVKKKKKRDFKKNKGSVELQINLVNHFIFGNLPFPEFFLNPGCPVWYITFRHFLWYTILSYSINFCPIIPTLCIFTLVSTSYIHGREKSLNTCLVIAWCEHLLFIPRYLAWCLANSP